MTVVPEKASRTAFFFSSPATADIRRGGSGIGANAGHVDEPPDAHFSRKPGDPCCGLRRERNGRSVARSPRTGSPHHDALDTRDGRGNGAIVIDVVQTKNYLSQNVVSVLHFPVIGHARRVSHPHSFGCDYL